MKKNLLVRLFFSSLVINLTGLEAAIGCMAITNPSASGFAAYDYVECACPCNRYKRLKRGVCSLCQHHGGERYDRDNF